MKTKKRQRPGEVTFAALPGPTRKRTPSPYCYRLVYQNDDAQAVGCALQWDVLGGREVYQVAMERLASGRLLWHCTCADAIYRGENRPHLCKHVRGLQALGRGTSELTVPQS
jgi:hypothetical protein